MGGIIGKLFNEFAVTIGAAILISGVVSLTFTPMLCSRWLKASKETKSSNPLTDTFERGWNWIVDRYEDTLKIVLNFRLAVLLSLIGMVWYQPAYCLWSSAKDLCLMRTPVRFR